MSNETPLKNHDGFHEKYLWEDPLRQDERFKDKIGPVLVAEEIKEYVTKYGLLIANRECFFEENLKGASYSMRPDPEEAWQYDENGEPVRLEIEEDDNGRYYRVKQNSLVYIRLQQCLRLPFYIIGRHNLTIKYVYQGLLLGTGPQVDPGWLGKLFIPLHNFTNQDVKIYLHKSFVSIDFVRTSHLIMDKGTPSSRKDFIERYPEKRPIPESKIRRSTLSDYLKGATPTSFLQEFIPRIEKQEYRVQRSLTKLKRTKYFDWGLLLAFAIALVTIGARAYTHLDNRLDSKIPIILEQSRQISAISERLDALSASVRDFVKSRGALERRVLNRRVKELEQTTGQLDKRIHKLETSAVKQVIK